MRRQRYSKRGPRRRRVMSSTTNRNVVPMVAAGHMHNGITAQNDATVNAADSVKAPAICHDGRRSLVANRTITKGMKTFTNGTKFITGIIILAQVSDQYDSDMPVIRHNDAASTCM